MAEAIATGLAVDAAKAATKLVTARVLDEITLACGFQDQLVKLHDKFSNIQALLEDLGSAKFVEKSRFVNLWLKKFTDLAYSADELMDDYEYELLRRKIELKNNHPSFKKMCGNFFSSATNPAVFRIRMSHRVREIISMFDELHKEAKNNGIQLGQLAREAVASTNVGYYVDDEALHQNRKHAGARGSEFVGRKSDEEKLLQMILKPSGKDVDRLSTVRRLVVPDSSPCSVFQFLSLKRCCSGKQMITRPLVTLSVNIALILFTCCHIVTCTTRPFLVHPHLVLI